MNTDDVMAQRRLARLSKAQMDARLVALHQRAATALQDLKSSEHVRKLALARVEKWDAEQLCNPRYVTAWRTILNMPVAAMCAAILTEEVAGVSLRQNSPFGFLLHEAG